jgi:hypothetical protein
MRTIRYLIGIALRVFWWPAVVGVIFVVGSGAIAYRVSTPHAGGGSRLDRWNRGFYLAASVKNAAVLVRTSKTDNMQLLLVDFETGKRIRLKSERSHLDRDFRWPDSLRFESVFQGFDGRIRLSRNDIWVFDATTGSRQLTDFKLYELHSLSVTDNEIYFSAFGSPRDKPVIPKSEPDANQQSNIFRLPFDAEKGTIETPSETMTPLFASAGIATQPSVSADGTLIAFLRTRTGINPYRYDLVIADRITRGERLIESSGMGFSRPVVIGHDVYASVTKDDRMLIRVDRPGEPSMKLLAELDDASVAAAQTVELKIEPYEVGQNIARCTRSVLA